MFDNVWIKYTISDLPFANLSFSTAVLVQNIFWKEDKFDWHENESAGETLFQMNAFAWDSFWHRGKSQLGNGRSVHMSTLASAKTM